MIASQRHLFDIPADVAYFNCAYMGPLMHEVLAAGERGSRRKARPWTLTAPDFFTEVEQARALFARLIGADQGDIAIVPAASYGMATAARAVPISAGDRIVVLDEQFPSNVYCWRETARERGAEMITVARPAAGTWTEPVLHAIDERTAVAALPNCHWADGTLLDLERISERCREAGAALVLDLTQSAGAMPFDVATVRPDCVVAACYKWLLGPYSLGFLYLAPSRQDSVPLEHNWVDRADSHDFAGLVRYRDEYQPGARRHDMGERASFHLMPMAIAALERLLDWGVDEIARTLAARTAGMAARARARGLDCGVDGERVGHYLGIRLPGGAPAGLVERLAAEQVHVSVRGDTVRATPHLYNTDEDVDRLFDVLGRVLA